MSKQQQRDNQAVVIHIHIDVESGCIEEEEKVFFEMHISFMSSIILSMIFQNSRSSLKRYNTQRNLVEHISLIRSGLEWYPAQQKSHV